MQINYKAYFFKRYVRFNPLVLIRFGIRLLIVRFLFHPRLRAELQQEISLSELSSQTKEYVDYYLIPLVLRNNYLPSLLADIWGHKVPLYDYTSASGIFYAIIVATDNYIDRPNRSFEQKMNFCNNVLKILESKWENDSNNSVSDTNILQGLNLLFINFRKRTHFCCIDPLIKDMHIFLAVAKREFRITDASKGIMISALIGGYSGITLYNIAMIFGAKPNLRRQSRNIGAVLNILDDIFDVHEDILLNIKTFMTVSKNLMTGTNLGYKASVKILKKTWDEMPMYDKLLWRAIYKISWWKYKYRL
jgi:hypothetical protein